MREPPGHDARLVAVSVNDVPAGFSTGTVSVTVFGIDAAVHDGSGEHAAVGVPVPRTGARVAVVFGRWRR